VRTQPKGLGHEVVELGRITHFIGEKTPHSTDVAIDESTAGIRVSGRPGRVQSTIFHQGDCATLDPDDLVAA
jgi:hypothetical protein